MKAEFVFEHSPAHRGTLDAPEKITILNGVKRAIALALGLFLGACDADEGEGSTTMAAEDLTCREVGECIADECEAIAKAGESCIPGPDCKEALELWAECQAMCGAEEGEEEPAYWANQCVWPDEPIPSCEPAEEMCK